MRRTNGTRKSTDSVKAENHPGHATGHVKWYNSAKGLGFLTSPDLEEDILLHKHTLHDFGRSSAYEGTIIEFEYVHTQNGCRVSKIINLLSPEQPDDHVDQPEADYIADAFEPARVKWFDPKRGYGFAQVYGSSEDVFVGIAVLKRWSLTNVRVGEAINIRVAERNGKKSVYEIRDWP